MDGTARCAACGGQLKRDVRRDQVTYKGHGVHIDQPGWYCTGCSEVVLEWDDAAVMENAFEALKVEVDGLLSPAEVTRIRKKLGLSQRKAGAILGGGPRSFQKYESGTDWVTRSMANLLRLLDNDPSRIKELTLRKLPDSRNSGVPNPG